MSQYSTDALLESMRMRGFLPEALGVSLEQILRLMSEELGLYITSLLKGIREEYLIATLDITVTSGTVDIPPRAAGGALRTVTWLHSDGHRRELVRIEPENRHEYGNSQGDPTGFMFQNNSLILLPAPTSGTIRLAYQQRPGTLVLESDCAEVTAINTGTSTVTVAAVPTAFDSAGPYDIVSATPNFTALALDQSALSITTTTMQFASLPSGLAIGDFVCVATQTCIPQMPYELATVLSQRTAYKIHEAAGSARAPAIAEGLRQAREDVINLLSPRDDGATRPIISRNGAGRRRGWW